MLNLITTLKNDENGFIVSAELVLVSTIAVLSLIVGLSELSNAINQELEDVASAFGAINQTYEYDGLEGHMGESYGSVFEDEMDFCDNDCDITSTWPTEEGY